MLMNDQLISRYGESLVLTVTHADPGAATVIMFPGFTGRRLNATNRALVAKLAPRGIRCVLGDLSGHGDSGGRIRQQTIIKASHEIDDIISHIRDIYSIGRLGLLGNSFSGNAAILSAARIADGLHALALKSPVTEYTEMRRSLLGEEGMRRWREQGWIELPDGTVSDYRFVEDADSVDTYRELARITAPILAIQGSADEEIPRSARRRLEKEMTRHGQDYRLVKGAKHDLRDPYFRRVIEVFADFLTDKLLQATPAKVNVPC